MLLVAKPSKAPSGKACSDNVAGLPVLLYRNKKIDQCSLILLTRLSCSLFQLARKRVLMITLRRNRRGLPGYR
jgi:hypothetical protein